MLEVLRRHKIDLLLVLILVLIDTGTKVAAYAFLPPGNWPIGIGDDLSLFLMLNDAGPALSRDAYAKYPSMPIEQAVAMLAMSAIIIALARSGMRWCSRVLASIGCFLAISLAAFYLEPLIPKGFVEPRQALILMMTSCLVLFLVLILCSTTRYFRACFTLMAAAGAGNLLSFFYPPFAVVDFIHSRWVSGVLEVGSSNVADVYALSCYLMLLAAPVYFLVRYLIKRPGRRRSSASPP